MDRVERGRVREKDMAPSGDTVFPLTQAAGDWNREVTFVTCALPEPGIGTETRALVRAGSLPRLPLNLLAAGALLLACALRVDAQASLSSRVCASSGRRTRGTANGSPSVDTSTTIRHWPLGRFTSWWKAETRRAG